jgi:NodT family efflux transporter outer membrane factor (OMF) lipoprotein
MKSDHMKLLMVPLALLGACGVGPDYVRPAIETPAVFKEGWKQAEPRDHEDRGKWWEVFNDPLLNGLQEQVSISNQTLARAEAQFRQAAALLDSARAATYPNLTGGVSTTRSRASSTTIAQPSAVPVSRDVVTSHNLPFNATWEADLWGRIGRTVEANAAGAQASAADLEAARLSAQAQLAQNYFQLRALDAQQLLLEDTVSAYEKSMQLTQNRYAAGVVARADVVQAQTQLKTTQAQAIDIGVQRAQLEHSLALLVGKPASNFSIPRAPLTAVPPPIPPALPSTLLERRPDIAAAERRMAAANAQIGVAKAAFFPSLTLSAGTGFQSAAMAQWLTLPSRFWSIGPAIAVPLFDGGLRQAATDQAIAAYDANVAAYRQTVLTGFQEVEDNLAALRILEQEARVQEEAVKTARLSVELTTNQYKAGIVTYLNVIAVQTTALGNERTSVDILNRRLAASVLLVKALGGGWNGAPLAYKPGRE